MRVLCLSFMVVVSEPSPTPNISWAYLRFIAGQNPPGYILSGSRYYFLRMQRYPLTNPLRPTSKIKRLLNPTTINPTPIFILLILILFYQSYLNFTNYNNHGQNYLLTNFYKMFIYLQCSYILYITNLNYNQNSNPKLIHPSLFILPSFNPMIEESSSIKNISQSESSVEKRKNTDEKTQENLNQPAKLIIDSPNTNNLFSQINKKTQSCINKICPKLKNLGIKPQQTKSQGFDPNLLCIDCLSQYNKQAYCLYCKQIYFDSSDDGKQWILCDGCGKWVHSQCANYDLNCDSEFRCIKCKKNQSVQNHPTLIKKQSSKPNQKQTERRKLAQCSLNAYGFYWQLDPKQLAQDIDKIREYLN